MTELIKLIITLAIAAVIFAGTGLAVQNLSVDAGQSRPETMPLPSPTDIQRMLIDRGHQIEADGIVGPKTRAAWEAEMIKISAAGVDYERD